jgi:hypothetical protein
MTRKVCPTCKRPMFRNKSQEQRGFFHAICTEIGEQIGMTMGQVKEAVKIEHFGFEEYRIFGKWYRGLQSSEDADRENYSKLIDTAIRWAAEEGGIVVRDPRQ